MRLSARKLDGTIVSWNAGAQRMYGHTAAEAVGQPITLIVPDDHREELRRILDEIGPAAASRRTRPFASRAMGAGCTCR